MKMPAAAIAAAITLLAAAAGANAQMAPAPAQDGSPVIPNDGRPVTTQGSIQGYNFVNYRVQVEAGETMNVNFQPDYDKCYFNVTGPDGALLYWSGKGGNNFVGAPSNAGEYTIKVFLRDNSARRGRSCNFQISFSAAPK